MDIHSKVIRGQQWGTTGQHDMQFRIHIDRVKILVMKQFNYLSKMYIGLNVINHSSTKWLIFIYSLWLELHFQKKVRFLEVAEMNEKQMSFFLWLFENIAVNIIGMKKINKFRITMLKKINALETIIHA